MVLVVFVTSALAVVACFVALGINFGWIWLLQQLVYLAATGGTIFVGTVLFFSRGAERSQFSKPKFSWVADALSKVLYTFWFGVIFNAWQKTSLLVFTSFHHTGTPWHLQSSVQLHEIDIHFAIHSRSHYPQQTKLSVLVSIHAQTSPFQVSNIFAFQYTHSIAANYPQEKKSDWVRMKSMENLPHLAGMWNLTQTVFFRDICTLRRSLNAAKTSGKRFCEKYNSLMKFIDGSHVTYNHSKILFQIWSWMCFTLCNCKLQD